jgi:hypothetical protein
MRKTTRTVAATFGILAGIAGLGHGVTEILQGNIRPASFMFASIGAPCVPEKAWHACEPAMTLLPNLLMAGILTVLMGLVLMVWSAAFIHRRNAGSLLILLSVILLLVGGGFFPPLIGIAGGIAGTFINKPLGNKPAGSLSRFASRAWPWPLVILVVWSIGQYLVGYLANDFLKSIMGFALLLILIPLPLSIYIGYAHDAAG